MTRRPPLPAFLAALAPLLLPVAATRAQEKPAPPPANAAAAVSLENRMDAALAVPGLKNALVGVLVRSLDSGRTLYERNADFALMPASNMKLLTASAALTRLGPEYRYTTTLYRTGTLAPDGTLTGDLYLKGTGDPSFDSARLKKLAEALKASGVTRFAGRIVADASRFDDQALGDGWQWDDEPFYYQAQVSGLNCDGNVVLLEVLPGDEVGGPATVRVGGVNGAALGFVGSKYLTLVNRTVTDPAVTAAPAGIEAVASGNTVRITRRRARNEVVVSGIVSRSDAPVARAVTVEDPALFAATRLAELLPVVGVATAGEIPVAHGTVPPTAASVAEDRSEPLSRLVARFLKASDNLYGECLLKTLGAEKGGAGTWAAGAKVVEAFLGEAGVESSGLNVADGSGLSRMNTVTPRLLVGLLEQVDRRFPETARAAFRDALPIGGVDGTLRNRFKATAAQNNLRAKTGTLSGVSGLSGYVTTRRGERLAFSILLNHYQSAGGAALAKRTEEALVAALLEAAP